MLGKNSNNELICMESNKVYRNFDPESYIHTIITEIHNSDVPDFETSCAYNFQDKMVKFEDHNIGKVPNDEVCYMTSKDELHDYLYFVNTSDVFIKLSLGGDCLSDTLKVKRINLAPRTIMVIKLDRVEAFNIQEEEGRRKKVFYKNTSDLDFNLEYNIYMTRLL